MRLNLGAADRHIPGFLCVDIAPSACAECDALAPDPERPRNPFTEGPTGRILHFEEVRRVDLARPWPWDYSSIEEIMALDVCEHIGDSMREMGTTALGPVMRRVDGRIHFMNHAHRVLVPGGRMVIETPDASRGVGYFQDPTHCAPWCLSSFKYFESGAFAHGRLAQAYGITAAFRVLSLNSQRVGTGENPAEEVFKIKAVLEAVK